MTIVGLHALFVIGILHRDLSNANVMYSIEDGQIHGVLLDFDLAVFLDKDGRVSNFRTGTPAFMAIDLLEEAKGPHLFRYDLESFLWVIMWYACNHNDVEKLQYEAFPGWFGSASECDIAMRKRSILESIDIVVTQLYHTVEEVWIVALTVLLYEGYGGKKDYLHELKVSRRLKILRETMNPSDVANLIAIEEHKAFYVCCRYF